MTEQRQRFDWVLLVALVIDSIALALLEMFFLPLRFDGTLLPDWGSWPFPVTAAVALVTMPPLISRAAGVSSRLLVAGAPLWAWLITIGVVGVVGTENMVLVEDWRTLLLLACGAMPAAVALGNSLARKSIDRASASASSTGSDGAAGSRASRTG
ncbi:MAG TPA: hypothetical protein VFX16_33635 [Pseudonocardiaceae bacterium]|nr:hypothetical protein [Pseudonocardiaceae bacterium]